MPEIEKTGSTLIAISPQLPGFSEKLIERHELRFDILFDEGGEVAARYGVRHDLPEDLIEVYRELGIDLEATNGDTSWRLPLPARYVIDTRGIIRHARVNADYRFRPEPSETLESLHRVAGNDGGR